jgi:hypothetical protein
LHFFDQVRLWFKNEGSGVSARRENLVTLSAPFWEELKKHPIPVDADVVRVLANNPGCLDLYTWLTGRCYQAKSAERIPLFGPFGLAAQLGVQEYARERKFRERIRGWLNWYNSTGPSGLSFNSSAKRRWAMLVFSRSVSRGRKEKRRGPEGRIAQNRVR